MRHAGMSSSRTSASCGTQAPSQDKCHVALCVRVDDLYPIPCRWPVPYSVQMTCTLFRADDLYPIPRT